MSTVDNAQLHSISVVIPTLGGDCLHRTIAQINRGSVVPEEILVCIPEAEAPRVASLAIPNIRVVVTPCRGQVAQRAIGFKLAQHPMVLQLDDDITLHVESLKALADALCALGKGNAVAPVYYDVATGRCIHELAKGGARGFLKNLYYSAICGAPWGGKRMGAVTPVGLCFGVDGSHCSEMPYAAEWLPGGCVLCFRDNLLMESFFPYPGKAYSEDLIHSFLRVRSGIRQWVIPGAQCIIDSPESESSPAAISAQRNARSYLVELSGGSAWRSAFYDFLSALRRTLSGKG